MDQRIKDAISIRRQITEVQASTVVDVEAQDRMLREAMVEDQRLDLTGKEFTLLEHFVVNHGRTVTRQELLQRVWRFDFDPGTNMVDVNVSRLRSKLKTLGSTCRVESKRGIGYVFAEE